MGVAAFETIGYEVPSVVAGKNFDQQIVAAWHAGDGALHAQPIGDLFWQYIVTANILEQQAHPVGEVGGQRHASALIGGDHGVAGAAFLAFHRHFVDAEEFQQAPGEHEGVAGA